MLVPSSLANALLIVVLVIPGFVFGSVRAYFQPPRGVSDTQLSSRIATAFVISVGFDAVYLIAVGLLLPDTDWVAMLGNPEDLPLRQPVVLGAVVLGLGIAFPVVVAVALYYRFEWHRMEALPEWLRWLHKPTRRGGYRNFPTAWDRAAGGLGGTFVRVRLEDGKWVGGWFSSGSFVSTYPHARDLFIEIQYNMSQEGVFLSPVPGSSGAWLAIGDRDVVEWITSPQDIENGGHDD